MLVLLLVAALSQGSYKAMHLYMFIAVCLCCISMINTWYSC